MKSRIRLTVSQFQVFDDEMGRFAAQLGIRNIQMNTPRLPGKGIWDLDALRDLKARIESYGLKLVMIENVPLPFYDKVILGLPGRDEQLDNYRQTIRNLASLGVEVFGHHFSPTFVWRTDTAASGRGGAGVTAFEPDRMRLDANALEELMRRKGHLLDYDVFEVASGLSEDELFRNYAYFLDAVLPVAEACGLKLALHPDDPPIKHFGGIERMITGLDDYRRAMELANSPMWGVNLCLGCCSEGGGAQAVRRAIEYLGERKKLFCVHFRDVQGDLNGFRECFLGEGNYDPAEMMALLIRLGYDGFIMEDHVSRLSYDSPYGHRARAHELGYMKGLIDMFEYGTGD